MASKPGKREFSSYDPLDVYQDIIKDPDPEFASIYRGGIRPAKTELVIGSPVIDRDGGFEFPVISYRNLKGKPASKDSGEWRYGTLSYQRYYRSQYVRDSRNQENHKSKWHVPEIIYSQGRFANEPIDPRNNKASKCDRCEGDLVMDRTQTLYCIECGLIHERADSGGEDGIEINFDVDGRCPKCRNKIKFEDGIGFCSRCGTKVYDIIDLGPVPIEEENSSKMINAVNRLESRGKINTEIRISGGRAWRLIMLA